MEEGFGMGLDECRQIIADVMPGREDQSFGPMSIGSTPASADEGVRVIIEGIKTATSSPLWDFPDGCIPFEGALSVLLDGQGKARAILETVSVEIIPFDQVSEDFAFAYGEGDRSLTWFRNAIGRWYEDYAAKSGAAFTRETRIICERIRVAARLHSVDR
ncbi:ASCH domain-containing protein [Sinorhizobium meliloti]|nr:ASCH domain-containing protein [Sinorhizobium meliloti]